MNQWTPEWDTRPPPRPDDYRAETPGPYTPPQPNLPDPYRREPRRWGGLIIGGVLAALFIVGLFVSASRDDTVVPIPNSPVSTGYNLPGQQSDPTLGGLAPSNTVFTPNVHKPGPPVVR